MIMKDFILAITIITTMISTFFGFIKTDFTPPDSNYPIADALQVEEKNLQWPEGQIFPTFSAPEGELVAFPADILPMREMTALSCLQGFVNAIDTRMVILESDVEKWLNDYGFGFTRVNSENVFDYIKELAENSVSGVVLYSDEISEHYVNLASSIGNLSNAIPLTAEAYDKWKANGIELPVIADIRGITYDNPTEIYKYFFDNYWDDCNKRILLVQGPGFAVQMRDLASAVGGAVVYLSCAGGTETKMFKEYLKDMKPGKSILTGWYGGQERELMTTAAQCGLSCVPSDHFSNPSVFAQDIPVEIPAVPDMPELQNKIYIAYFLSDGDNIQYNMHAMRLFWDDNRHAQGKVPVNWTISPALVDIAPGMMNYYYRQATDTECFVCGPSGLGYTMPVNTYGSNLGIQFLSNKKFDAFTDMTNGYLRKAGLRTVTIWDNLTLPQRNIYTKNGDYLYGITVHNFTNSSLCLQYTSVSNDTLVVQLTPSYFATNAEGTTPITDIENDIKAAIKYHKYNGKKPVFVAAQASSWAFHNINDVAYLEEHLSDYYEEIYGEDVVEFVRADHFFNLYYEAKNRPLDITLKNELTATATSNSEDAILTADGTTSAESIWTAAEEGQQSITYSLGKAYKVNEISLYHAELSGLDPTLNTKSFKVEISEDGSTWKKAGEVKGNTEEYSNLKFKAINGAYVKITITDPGSDNIARISDIDIWGKLK